MAHFTSYTTTRPENAQAVLAANEELKLETLQTDRAQYIVGSVFSDQGGTVFIEQSFNGGENWDISNSHTVVAKEGQGFKQEVLAPLVRIRYTNGATKQGEFRLYVRTVAEGF